MKFSLTISGDSADANDKKALREITAIVNSTAAGQVPITAAAAEEDDETAAPVNIAPGETDSAGLPWDARIHSGAKGKNADGTWRKVKGVDKSIIPGVEAELRARSGISPLATAPVAPVNVPTVSTVPPPSPAQVAPPVQPPSAPPAAATATGPTFAEFMGKFSAAQMAKKIDEAFTTWLFTQVGVAGFGALAADPSALARADALMIEHGRYV